MEHLLRLLLTNALAAAVIGAAALVVSRTVRRPAAAHALWLLALVKLVTPPIVPLPLLPPLDALVSLPAAGSPTIVRLPAREPGPQPAAQASAATLPALLAETGRSTVSSSDPTTGSVAAAPPDPGPSRSWETAGQQTTWRSAALPLLAALLAAGASTVLVLAAWRFARFRRLLQTAGPAPPEVSASASELAASLGLRRAPPLRVVDARLAPMLWPEPGGPLLLLPRDLLAELSPKETETLLAHELAHVQRRDHWVRLLELGATALFWWYPLAWWTRAALRRAEERCCDESVLRALPGAAEAYANGLLKTLTFVSSAPALQPALASGASPLHELEERLREILMSRPAPRLAPFLRIALLVLAAACVAVFPTQAREKEPPRAPAAPAAPPAVPARPAAPPARPAAVPAAPTAPAAVADAPARPTPAVAAVLEAALPAPDPQPVATPAPAAAPAALPQAASPATPATPSVLQQATRLERQRRELARRQLELQRKELELESESRAEEMRGEAERLRAEGRAREAEVLEKRIELGRRQMDLARHRLEIDAERLELEAKLEAAEHGAAEASAAVHQAFSDADREAVKRAAELAAADRARVQEQLQKQLRAVERSQAAVQGRARSVAAEREIAAATAETDALVRALVERAATIREGLAGVQVGDDVERAMQQLQEALVALEAATARRAEAAAASGSPARSDQKPQR